MGEAKRRRQQGDPGYGKAGRRKLMPLLAGVGAVILVVVLVIFLTTFKPADTEVSVARTVNLPDTTPPYAVVAGPADAPVVVREFADYQCPGCRSFSAITKRLRETRVAEGEVRFEFFDLPLTRIHPNAMEAALAARCAGDQDAYWPMHDRLFEGQSNWSGLVDPTRAFVAYAEDLGLATDRFRRCLDTELHREDVEDSIALAKAIGITGTPSLIVGDALLRGVPDWDGLMAAIAEQRQREQ